MTREQTDWHRLFGLSWSDLFTGTTIEVAPERDLSSKVQRLDVLILRKDDSPLPEGLPDGFEDLARYNLISFKSYQEALDGWALNELVGHYVNARKQVSPNVDELLPECDFRLFAVAVRSPAGLAQRTTLRRLRDGVYEVDHFTGSMRVIVIHQLPQEQQNARLLIFSAKTDLLEYAGQNYRIRSPVTTSFLGQLLARYRQEGVLMSTQLEEFIRDARAKILEETPIEKRLEGIPPEKRLEGLTLEQRLAGLSEEQRQEMLRLLQQNRPSAPT